MFLRIPELQILLYAFLIHLSWESAQAPLFIFKEQSSIVLLTGCLFFCSGVDALMTLSAFWIVSAVAKDRYWFLSKKYRYSLLFVTTSFLFAFVSEYSAIHHRKLWEYSDLMPVFPGIELGLAPLLQWLFLPPLVLFLLIRGFR